ncbi:MAG: metal-dependent hydrolase, partial [Patescibacteria group bacterium]
MTGRTHDLVAFTGMIMVLAYLPVTDMSLATAVVGFGANMLGGLGPDLDEATADIWDKLRGGSLISRIISPLLGGHRLISHSILGMWLIGIGLKWLLAKIGAVLIVDMNIVWWAFMIGYASHLISDMLTKEGVPLLFPIPIKFGFPPFKALRITTGKIMEKA